MKLRGSKAFVKVGKNIVCSLELVPPRHFFFLKLFVIFMSYCSRNFLLLFREKRTRTRRRKEGVELKRIFKRSLELNFIQKGICKIVERSYLSFSLSSCSRNFLLCRYFSLLVLFYVFFVRSPPHTYLPYNLSSGEVNTVGEHSQEN